MDLRPLLELRQAFPLSFARDGETLLVASDLPGTRQLHSVATRGGELLELTDFPEPVDGQLLPDGRILLAMDEGGNERTQLYLLAPEPGAEPKPLVVDPRFIHGTPQREPRRDAARVRDEPAQRARLRRRRAQPRQRRRSTRSSSAAGAASSRSRPTATGSRRAGSASAAATATCTCSGSRAARSSTSRRTRARRSTGRRPGCPTRPASSRATNEGRETRAIGRYDLAARHVDGRPRVGAGTSTASSTAPGGRCS